jgi:DNA-directed RNA polymerase subunit M/transcription elongation factor TFIIS
MKTLEQHEREVREKHNYKERSDIKCPKCPDGEFYFVDNVILLSYPPQRNVRCNSCDFRTSIIV